ncbi:MAG: DUF1802 family protein [Bryobacteraceae bacterium]
MSALEIPASTNIALKEWAALTEALLAGRQIFLLRKGGIVEARRGFELRHPGFLFFPTLEHQHYNLLKPEDLHWLNQAAAHVEPNRILLRCFAVVDTVLPAPASAGALHAAARHFIWNDTFLEQRYAYRPDLPMYLIVVRTFRLAHPQAIPDREAYTGCKSWVNLTEEIDLTGCAPVLSGEDFDVARQTLLADFG